MTLAGKGGAKPHPNGTATVAVKKTTGDSKTNRDSVTDRDPSPRENGDYRFTRLQYLRGVASHLNDLNLELDDHFQQAIKMVIDIGISQADLALKIGVSRPSISRWSVKDRMPRIPTRKAVFAELKEVMHEEIKKLDPPIPTAPSRTPRHRGTRSSA